MQKLYIKINRELDNARKMRDDINLIEGNNRKSVKRIEDLRKIQDEIYHKALFKRNVLKARDEKNGRAK